MSWSDRVAALAVQVLRDPTSTTEDRADAKRALTEDRTSAVASLLATTRLLSSGDQDAVMRFMALVNNPNAPYDPPRECPRSVPEVLALLEILDPERKALSALIAAGTTENV